MHHQPEQPHREEVQNLVRSPSIGTWDPGRTLTPQGGISAYGTLVLRGDGLSGPAGTQPPRARVLRTGRPCPAPLQVGAFLPQAVFPQAKGLSVSFLESVLQMFPWVIGP